MVVVEGKIKIFFRIKCVWVYVFEFKFEDQGVDCYDVEDIYWINGYFIFIVNLMFGYEQYVFIWKFWGINVFGILVVEVEVDDGICGVGVIIGGVLGCYIVENYFSRFVEGQDFCDVEFMWDQMFRVIFNYGCKGLLIQCISVIDLVLWDLFGKLRNEFVYVLFGGKIK